MAKTKKNTPPTWATKLSLWPCKYLGTHAHINRRGSRGTSHRGPGHSIKEADSGPALLQQADHLWAHHFISPKYRNGNLQTLRLEIPNPLANKKKVFLQQSFSPDSGAPYTPKVSIPSWVVSKEGVMKDPMSLLMHWYLQKQLTVKDSPRHIWTAAQLEPAHCLLLHVALCKITSRLGYCSSETWGTAWKPPARFWLEVTSANTA